ncbi:protein SEEDLING LETHAL 1, chloroplastic [Silene latifolia]|uniref:protein SEEDLING LETHAL 1, chloroplastic n=1 Tax=Silene latifolia TaxID=37657 RepID=UPI003D77F16C
MQDSLHFPATTTTAARNPLASLLPFSRHKTLNFSPLSSKSTTTITIQPIPPSPLPILPSTSDFQPLIDDDSEDVRNLTPLQPDNHFQDKIFFLDSQGLDPLTNFPPSAIADAAPLHDLTAVFDYLASLGFSPPDLRRAISMCPQILTLSLRDIAAVFTFLLREAGVPSTSLRRVIRRRPRLLISDVDARLRPTMYFLQSIGIHEIHKHTDLLSSSVEDKYLPKIQYFEKLGFSYRDAVSMFRKFPALFCYSVKENFEPKFNYFVVEMGRDLKELKEFPHYFSFSLEQRIKPRHQCCVESGVCLPLPALLKMKEDKFREKLEICCNSSLPRSTSPLWSAEQIFDPLI